MAVSTTPVGPDRLAAHRRDRGSGTGAGVFPGYLARGKQAGRLAFVDIASLCGQAGDPADLEFAYGHLRTSRAPATGTAVAMVSSASKR